MFVVVVVSLDRRDSDENSVQHAFDGRFIDETNDEVVVAHVSALMGERRTRPP